MADKIAAENAERQKKEEEMAQRLKEAQEVQYQEATYIESRTRSWLEKM
jgi:hypothetical protein